MLCLVDNYKLNGERASTIRKKNDGGGTETVKFIIMQAAGRAATGHPHPTPHSRSQRKMYLLDYRVMKIKTVKPEKAIGI